MTKEEDIDREITEHMAQYEQRLVRSYGVHKGSADYSEMLRIVRAEPAYQLEKASISLRIAMRPVMRLFEAPSNGLNRWLSRLAAWRRKK